MQLKPLSIVSFGLAVLTTLPAVAQQQTTPPLSSAVTMQRLQGVWVEGPGYDIKYGADYETCAARCLATQKCMMIEYYRPEKKCNMYDARRPTKAGGSSNVAVKTP